MAPRRGDDQIAGTRDKIESFRDDDQQRGPDGGAHEIGRSSQDHHGDDQNRCIQASDRRIDELGIVRKNGTHTRSERLFRP